jgi:hypothetical protein
VCGKRAYLNVIAAASSSSRYLVRAAPLSAHIHMKTYYFSREGAKKCHFDLFAPFAPSYETAFLLATGGQ